MKKKFLYIGLVTILLLSFSSCVFTFVPSTTTTTAPRLGSISGRIKSDAHIDTWLNQVSVAIAVKGSSVPIPDKNTTSDINGYYTISNVQPGDYTVYFQKLGYIDQNVDIRVTAGTPTLLNIILVASKNLTK